MKLFAIATILLASCAGILGLRRGLPDAFPHRRHVVAGVACTRCHVGVFSTAPHTTPDLHPADATSPAADNLHLSTDALRAADNLHLPTDAACVSCHTKPHNTRPCSGCHSSPRTLASLIDARQHLKFDHARHAKPTSGNCMRCHDAVGQSNTALRPTMATCFRCHASDAERDGRRCDVCHTDLAESGTLPASHLAHDGDWLREHGVRAASSGQLCETCHHQSFCASCHGQTAPVLPAMRRLADPISPTIHRAGFATRHALEAKSDPGACTMCHAPDRCAGCHAARGVGGLGGRNPHPAGWVGLTAADNLHGREARRDPASCAGCHGGAGESLCITCHRVGGVGGNPHPPGWSSQLPLSALPCKLCHPVGAR